MTVLNFSSYKKSFLTTPNAENKFYMKHLKVLVEWNWQWRFTCVCPIYMNFEFYFLEFPIGNCFWCNFRQLFISWAFKKYKKDCNILKIIFVQDFSPPKTETAQFTNGFHLHVKHFFNKSICGERENSKCTNVLQNPSQSWYNLHCWQNVPLLSGVHVPSICNTG